MAKGFPLRVTRRADISIGKAWLVRLCAILLALLTGGVFVAVLGYDPLAVYQEMISGSLGSRMSIELTAKLTIPLLITSLGVTLAFKMRFWNIGAEGQICVGAIAATYFALFHDDWPQWILLIVMALAGILAGGLYGMIPAYFKCRFGTNETLLTLMLNYVALYTIQALQQGPWRDPTQLGFFKVARFSSSARVPEVLGVHAGWIVALILVALFYVYLRHSKQGYELTVVGENEATARYAGMPVKRVVIRTMFLSAGVCGLAGMLQASGADRTLNDTVAGGVGFTAITVAWLARLNPIGMLIVSVLFCILEKGCASVQSVYNLSAATAEVLQGIILFFVLGCEFFLTHRVCRASKLEGGVERG